jgi:hypothetical protein
LEDLQKQVGNMVITIYLQTRSWITDALGAPGNQTYAVEKKVESGSTLLSLLTGLANNYPEFKERVFNPETGQLSDQVLLLINDSLVRFDQVKSSPLHDKEAISLVPVIFGG